MTTVEHRPVRSVLRLRAEERAQLDAAAKRGHYRSTADFIRHAALRAADAMCAEDARHSITERQVSARL